MFGSLWIAEHSKGVSSISMREQQSSERSDVSWWPAIIIFVVLLIGSVLWQIKWPEWATVPAQMELKLK
jgi:hypothetical protein